MSTSSFEMTRDCEEIRKRLEKHKDYYETMLAGLENVKIKRKKDGTHFANVNQTFENGKVVIPNYSDEFHKVFQYYARSEKQGCMDFSFDVYVYTDTLPDGDSRKEKGISTASFMRETYTFNTDEIIAELAKQKGFARSMIKAYDGQLKALETVFPLVESKLQELKDLIYSQCKDFRDNPIYASSLEYALHDFCKSNMR